MLAHIVQSGYIYISLLEPIQQRACVQIASISIVKLDVVKAALSLWMEVAP